MSERTVAQLAMYLESPQADAQDDGVFGRDVVIDEWLSALLSHGAGGAYRFFQQRNRLRAHSLPGFPSLEKIARGRSEVDLSIEDVSDLPGVLHDDGVRIWHDTDGDLHIPVAARSRFASRLYPITATTHVLSYKSLRHQWFLRLLLQDIQRCDSLICTSTSARIATERSFANIAEQLERSRAVRVAFGGRVDVIPLGVDTERFRPRPRAALRRSLGLPVNALLIGWIGRISTVDKADLLPLVTVFARLVRANPGRDIHLVLAGSGEEIAARMIRRHAITLGIMDRVSTIDPLPPARRHLVHAALDVFVSPADNAQETFGITPIEALACGVPQVVSDWNGYRDTVRDGDTGFLIPTSWSDDDSDATDWGALGEGEDFVDHLMLAQATAIDLHAFERALQRLVDDADLRARMGEASRRRAVATYAWPVIIEQYEQLWNELATIARGTPWPPAHRGDYAAARFTDTFAHYATRRLDATSLFALTPAGQSIIDGDDALPAYLIPTGLWSAELFTIVLTRMAASPQPVSMAELDALARTNMRRTSAATARHVMWLLKYGFITS
ncbi:MAG: hypothetical protein JWM95_3354 [Gemmatimonadetes bacterium]|nr:hypothetical protein [Gemmatimonadota bacterium]